MKWLLVILGAIGGGTDIESVVYIDRAVCERAAETLDAPMGMQAWCVPYDGDRQ